MGRRKVEIKRIQEKSCRQIAFCKRRKGLLKKAKALSTLCDVDVAAVIYSNSGKLYEFSNTNSLTGILQRYESHIEAEKEISAEILVEEHSKYSRFMTMRELLQTTERQLEKTNADGLTVTDLVHLENELHTALIQARSRKAIAYCGLRWSESSDIPLGAGWTPPKVEHFSRIHHRCNNIFGKCEQHRLWKRSIKRRKTSTYPLSVP